MPRIRSIKPDFTSSETLAKISREARLALVNIIAQSDDDGCLPGGTRQLLGLLYPHDEDVTAEVLLGWIGELTSIDVARWLTADDGSRILELVNWHKHQRIDHRSNRTLLAKVSRRSREDATTGVGVGVGVGVGKGSRSRSGSGTGRGAASAAAFPDVTPDPKPAPPAAVAGAGPAEPPPLDEATRAMYSALKEHDDAGASAFLAYVAASSTPFKITAEIRAVLAGMRGSSPTIKQVARCLAEMSLADVPFRAGTLYGFLKPILASTATAAEAKRDLEHGVF